MRVVCLDTDYLVFSYAGFRLHWDKMIVIFLFLFISN